MKDEEGCAVIYESPFSCVKMFVEQKYFHSVKLGFHCCRILMCKIHVFFVPLSSEIAELCTLGDLHAAG